VKELIEFFEGLIDKHVQDKELARTIREDLNQGSIKIAQGVNEFFLQDLMKEYANQEVETKRVDHLCRIIIHQIEDLFPARDDKELNDRLETEFVEGVIPRQIIPMLYDAVKGIFGTDFMDAKQEECKVIVSNHFQPWCMRTDWDGVFTDDDTKKIVTEIVTEIKRILENDENYKSWFIKVIRKSEVFFASDEFETTKKEYTLPTEAFFRSLAT